MQKKILFLIFILSTSLSIKAQKDSLIYYLEKQKHLEFPIFSNKKKVAHIEKINQVLQISELGLLKGSGEENIFRNFKSYKEDIYHRSIKTKVICNNRKVLSIQFKEASCGATCGYWVSYYNFNATNGDLFNLKDLFTPSGYTLFQKYASTKRIKHLNEELLKVEKSKRTDFLNVISSYKRIRVCDFYIKDDALIIDGENCFLKYQKFDGINTICKFSLLEIESYLSDFGKEVLGNKKNIGVYTHKALPCLFEGTLGAKKILLILNPPNRTNKIYGKYVYLKFGQGIMLEGKMENNTLQLTERYQSKITGYFKGNIRENSLIEGIWTNPSRTTNLKFKLTKK